MTGSRQSSSKASSESGLSLIELVVATALAILVTAGVLQIFKVTSMTLDSTVNDAQSDGLLGLLRKSISGDVSIASQVVIATPTPVKSQHCTSWIDSQSFSLARPLFTFLTVNQSTGRDEWIGYELVSATSDSSSSLTRVTCASPGSIPASVNVLVSGLPLPTESTWDTAVAPILMTTKQRVDDPKLEDKWLALGTNDIIKRLPVNLSNGTVTRIFLGDNGGVAPRMLVFAETPSVWSNGRGPDTGTVIDTTTVVFSDSTSNGGEFIVLSESIGATAASRAGLRITSVAGISIRLPEGQKSESTLLSGVRKF